MESLPPVEGGRYARGAEALRRGLVETRRRALAPPQTLTLSQWAQRHAVLSPETSAQTGRFRAYAYQDGIMDAFTDPTVTEITVMKSARDYLAAAISDNRTQMTAINEVASRSDAGEIGHWLAHNPPFPDVVLVSSAVRAQQTWDRVWEAMKDRVPAPEVETLDELYGAEPTQLLKTIRMAASSDPKQLMLIGHNPGMHEMALMLAGSGDKASIKAVEDNLPTSGLAIIDFDIKDWTEMAFRRGKLVSFVSPKLLRQMSKD